MTNNVDQTYQERILKVLIYIQNHLDDELSLESLAEIAFFSPFHFHRVFSGVTGESIKSYVRRLRLERATLDLRFTDLSLTQIATRAGYDTQQSFHRAFKEAHNTTPKLFRNQSQKDFSDLFQKQPNEKKSDIVAVKIIEPIPVAFVRHVGSYSEITQTWFQLIAEVGLNILSDEKTLKISIAHDSPDTTSSDKLRYDACITLNELNDFKPKGNIGKQTLHGGKYAVITHHGDLNNIEATYQYLFGYWLPQSGYEPADYPNFIVHHKIPFQTQPEELVTDIYLPLK